MSQGASGGHRWRTSVGTVPSHRTSPRTKRAAWTVLVMLLGGVAVWLLFQFFGVGRPPRLQIVSIGMTYDNQVFRPTPLVLESVQAINELAQRENARDQFVLSNYPTGTKLDGPKVLDIFKDLSLSKHENLLVYLNLQGGVIAASGDEQGGVIAASGDEPGAMAYFLTLRAGADSLHDGVGGQRVRVQELLSECGKTTAANVLVLLESGDGGPNWRTGILNRDFQNQLKREAEQAVQKYPQLRVIGAVSDQETAHAARQFGDDPGHHSVFSHFAVQGLLGDADGYTFDARTGRSSPGERRSRKVRTVSFDELFAYLHHQVELWSKDHRAARQTVWRIPKNSPPLNLTQTRASSRFEQLADAASKVVTSEPKSKEAEPEVESDSKNAAKKDAQEDSKAKDQESLATADSKGSTTHKPTDGKGDKPQTRETSSPSSKRDTTDGDPVADKSHSAKADSEDASQASEQRKKQHEQLFQLWERRDSIRTAGHAASLAAREWRRLQLELVHVEQCLRAEETPDRVNRELDRVTNTLMKIEEQVARWETQRHNPVGELVSLAFVERARQPRTPTKPRTSSPANPPLSGVDQGTNEPTGAERKQFDDLLKAAFPSSSEPELPSPQPDRLSEKPKPATTTSEDKSPTPAKEPRHVELKQLLLKFPQLRESVWQSAFRPISEWAQPTRRDERTTAEVLKLLAAVQLADELTQDRAGRSAMPAEIVTTLGVLAVAEASAQGKFPWTSDVSRACRQLIDARVRFEQLVTDLPANSKLMRHGFETVEDQLVAAERWLQSGQVQHTLRSLDQVEISLASSKTDAETLRRVARLKADLAAELPDLARWVARRQDSTGQNTLKTTRKLLQNFAEARQIDEVPPIEELEELRGLVRSQDESWFALFDVIELATELLKLTAEEPHTTDARTPKTTAESPDSSRLKEITALTAKLEQLWTEWRGMERELAALLSSGTPLTEHWERINDLLFVPWISAAQRRQLLSQLEKLDQAGSSNSEGFSSANTRGDWQVFWAIETLRLAGLDSESERALWGQFSKSLKVPWDDDDWSASFAATAELGQKIARNFAKIARQADASALEMSTRQEDEDLRRREQRTRGVDPADLATPGAQAEFWLAKRSSDEYGMFLRERAARAARTARLGGQEFASQWTSLAERWQKLVPPSVTRIPADEAPFVVETKFDGPLYWSRGDPGEIKLSLVIAPRAGFKYRPTLLRVLDGDRFTIKPQSLSQSIGHELIESRDAQQLELTFHRPKSVTVTESIVTLALLDKETQLPWDMRRLVLRTPLNDQDWRIEFRAQGELTERDHPAAKDRNKGTHSSNKLRSVLWLPTLFGDKPPLALRPVLIPPLDTNFASVSVTVHELDDRGQPRQTPSAKQVNIPLNREGRPIPLSLAAAPAAAPPAATTTEAKPTPSPTGRDVSRGWVFEILPVGERDPVLQQVIPRVRPPQTYFNPSKLKVVFGKGELKFELQRRTDAEEIDRALLPETLRVQLELPDALGVLPTDAQLLWNFERGERKSLIARLDERRLAKVARQNFLVSVNAGGWPRAFPYRVRHDDLAVESPPTRPVIVSPANGAVIPMGKKLSVGIQIDSEQLNTFGLDEPWMLACELVSVSESEIIRRPAPFPIFRSLDEIIRLVSQGESDWMLTAEVRNHQVEFDTDGLKGRFFARAVATRDGQKTTPLGGGDSEKLLIAISDPERQPPTPKLAAATLPKIRPGSENDWRVPIIAEDSQAGISEVTAGFDTDDDGQLGEKEVFEETRQTWDNPLDEADRQTTVIIRAARLKDKPTGKHRLLVTAKNGVGKLCKEPLVVPLEVDQALGWVAVRIPDLGQKKCVLYIDGNKQAGTAAREMSVALAAGEHEFQLASDIVDTRRGKAKKVLVKPEHTKDSPAQVTLDPPTQ